MPRRFRPIADGPVFHVIAGPMIRDGEHWLTVLRSIEADPLRAGLAARAGDILKGS
jgi:hypothetical protein